MNTQIKYAVQWGLCGLLLTGAGCQQEDDLNPRETDPSKSVEAPQSETPPRTNAAPDGEELTRQVDLAIADLSERAGVATDAITVTRASLVNWGSGAVGCPKEGMGYTQAILPGLLVLLEANSVVYRYHGSAGSNVFYCPEDRAQAPAYGSGEEFM